MRAERLSNILDGVAERGSVGVGELSALLDVSDATIRRDLQALHEQGLLVRTHGGAMSKRTGAERPIRFRVARQHEEKRRIGAAAAALVEDGAVVGMTGGTTGTEVARALAERRNITVVTNALNIAAELMSRADIRLVVVGGNARHASYELVGPAAEAMVAQYHFDLAFIGTDGFSIGQGCTTHDEMEAHTDLAFIRQAARTVVIADSTKMGKVTFARICGLDAVHDLITDAGADTTMLAAVRIAGVRVVIA
jgi:DeoR family transcriptional regulator of aga operon